MADHAEILAMLANDPELNELRRREAAYAVPVTEGLAMVGGVYYLCGVAVAAPTVGHMLRLAAISSPFATGATDDMEPMDMWRALYVFACPDALEPIIGHAQRMRTMRSLEPEEDGLKYRAWLARCDAVAAGSWGVFDERVIAFSERFVGATTADVYSLLAIMMQDAQAAWVGGSDSTELSKKKEHPRLTPSGALASSRRLLSAGCRIARRWLRLSARLGRSSTSGGGGPVPAVGGTPARRPSCASSARPN